jgi:hypothetical protein
VYERAASEGNIRLNAISLKAKIKSDEIFVSGFRNQDTIQGLIDLTAQQIPPGIKIA